MRQGISNQEILKILSYREAFLKNRIAKYGVGMVFARFIGM
jgi:hypothetical protein